MAVKSVVKVSPGGTIKMSESSGGEAVIIHEDHSGHKTIKTTGVGGK